jgi:hypothetical protein
LKKSWGNQPPAIQKRVKKTTKFKSEIERPKARFSTWKLGFNPWITSMQFTILLYGSLILDFQPVGFSTNNSP